MSVKIFEDQKTGEVVIQTTCLTVEDYLFDLAEALHAVSSIEGDGALRVQQTLQRAMPVAFKLAGYKADEVREQRTLVCGNVSPEHCRMLADGGK